MIPYPFEQLVAAMARTGCRLAYLGQPVKMVLIPLGRSLQRRPRPGLFHSPRIVLAVDSEPVCDAGLLLRDRLFIGYSRPLMSWRSSAITSRRRASSFRWCATIVPADNRR